MRFWSWGYVLAVVAFVSLMFPDSPGCADLYKWVDENGTVWFTDDPSKLPKESHGEFEKEKAEKKPSDSPAQGQPPRRPATKTTTSRSAGTYLQKQNQRLQEKKALEQEISTLEEQLAIAREALQKVWLSDRVGYWFVVDPETGKKVRASRGRSSSSIPPAFPKLPKRVAPFSAVSLISFVSLPGGSFLVECSPGLHKSV